MQGTRISMCDTKSLVIKLLEEQIAAKKAVSVEDYILKDLRLYGDDYQEFVNRFFETTGKRVSPEFYDSILSLLPSEWHSVFGGIFAKRPPKDITVGELVSRLIQGFEVGKHVI